MKVILVEKVLHLGKTGQTVTVRSGHARNFLLPYGKAIVANEQNTRLLRDFQKKVSGQQRSTKREDEKRIERIGRIDKIVVTAKSSPSGRLFGSVGAEAIARKICARGCAVRAKEIKFPNGTIQDIGNHTIEIHCPSVSTPATLRIVVVGNESVSNRASLCDQNGKIRDFGQKSAKLIQKD